MAMQCEICNQKRDAMKFLIDDDFNTFDAKAYIKKHNLPEEHFIDQRYSSCIRFYKEIFQIWDYFRINLRDKIYLVCNQCYTKDIVELKIVKDAFHKSSLNTEIMERSSIQEKLAILSETFEQTKRTFKDMEASLEIAKQDFVNDCNDYLNKEIVQLNQFIINKIKAPVSQAELDSQSLKQARNEFIQNNRSLIEKSILNVDEYNNYIDKCLSNINYEEKNKTLAQAYSLEFFYYKVECEQSH